jgi:hypothetical protein
MRGPFRLLPQYYVSDSFDDPIFILLMCLMMIMLQHIMMLIDLPIACHVNLRG